MARPSRSLWVPRAYARHRHRTWMRSMMLATLGWAGWWTFAIATRLAPSLASLAIVPEVFGCATGAVGLLLALWSLRAQRAWVLLALAPLFANATLVLFPWVGWGWLRG